MQKNIGRLDAQIRISVGLTALAIGILQKSLLCIVLGSCKVSEGVTRFCPVMYMLGWSTRDNEKNSLWN